MHTISDLLSSGRIDLALTYRRQIKKSLPFVALFQATPIAFIPTAWPLAKQNEVNLPRLPELVERPMIKHFSTGRAPGCRGDSHYGRAEAMAWCEENGVDYIFGIAGNRALHALAYEVADDLKVRRAEAGADRMRSFAAFPYAARSWSRERRVLARLEASTRGFDARYVVTSLKGEPRNLYEDIYCARGQAENPGARPYFSGLFEAQGLRPRIAHTTKSSTPQRPNLGSAHLCLVAANLRLCADEYLRSKRLGRARRLRRAPY